MRKTATPHTFHHSMATRMGGKTNEIEKAYTGTSNWGRFGSRYECRKRHGGIQNEGEDDLWVALCPEVSRSLVTTFEVKSV